MEALEQFKVVKTVVAPPPYDGTPHQVEEAILSAEELSIRYPRARSCGGLVLATYDLETGIESSERYEERIVPSADNKDTADPRLFDDEIDPALLPYTYIVGEGYAQWQARLNPMGAWYYGVANNPRYPLLQPTSSWKEKVLEKIEARIERSPRILKLLGASERKYAERNQKFRDEMQRLTQEDQTPSDK